MADLTKYSIGQPIKEILAGTHNALVDDYFRRRGQPPGQRPNARPPLGSQPYVVAEVHNSTSGIIEPGEIFGFSAPIFTTAEVTKQYYSAPNLKGIAPDATTHANQFAVALDYVGVDKVGPCVVVGLAWVQVNWTDEAHTHVKVVTGEHKLQSGTSGIKPVYHDEIPLAEYLPATIWALVLLGGGGSSSFAAFNGIVTTEISGASGDTSEVIPGSGMVQFLEGAVGSNRTPVGEPAEVFNYITTSAVPVGTLVHTTESGGGELVSADCGTLDEGT